MAIRGRHIRHDWQTFVDWEQQSVKAVCGAKTQRHLAGIPGITDQPAMVPVKGKTYYGWCSRCVGSVFRTLQDIDASHVNVLVPQVRALYEGVAEALLVQVETMRINALANEKARHLNTSRHQSGACLTDGRGCQAEKPADAMPIVLW
jgi:hypothetical protein